MSFGGIERGIETFTVNERNLADSPFVEASLDDSAFTDLLDSYTVNLAARHDRFVKDEKAFSTDEIPYRDEPGPAQTEIELQLLEDFITQSGYLNFWASELKIMREAEIEEIGPAFKTACFQFVAALELETQYTSPVTG